MLVFLFVDVVDAHQRAGEGGYFPERDEERFMDLAFGVNEDSAEEEDEAAKGQNCGCDYLNVIFHCCCFKNKTKGRNTFWLFSKSGANMPTILAVLQIFCQKVFHRVQQVAL